MATPKKQYSYNPHNHVKIWLSNKPSVFMNAENQMRLIRMREQNPTDNIALIFDSSLLNPQAIADLNNFCKEHNINPVDADGFAPSLNTEKEKELYKFYKDEITHLKEGGNLAVASDIIRWIPPVYTRGTYTDFDVPVNTSSLPRTVDVKAPVLLNIGSLQIRNKEWILANNDYIAVIDPVDGKDAIEKVQDGFIKVLGRYTNDFMERTEAQFGSDSIINRYLVNFMKNRSESIYIARSKNNFDDAPRGSRELRHHINQIMTDPIKFLEFNKLQATETNETVIQRLRADLNNQLGLMKWLFFRNEYKEIKRMLEQPDDKLITYLMKKERSLYLKSIVVCTTGPLAISNFLFGGYVFKPKEFSDDIQHYSFNHYGLKKAFQSQNSIPMHENILGMMNFLGVEDGALNDSSWLEEGAKLQQSRGEILENKKTQLKDNLPTVLLNHKADIEKHIKDLEASCKGFFGFFWLGRKQAKLAALREVVTCFNQDVFDTKAFSKVIQTVDSNQSEVYAGLIYNQTKACIESLKLTCLDAIVFGLTKDRQIPLANDTRAYAKVDAQTQVVQEPTDQYHAPGLAFFAANASSESSSSVPDEPGVSFN
jgi:glucosyltransferase Lgt1/2/3